jgi:drug/metabolite transporter (DMT)-like permease
MGIAAIAMNLILLVRGTRLPNWRQWGPFFVLAALANVLPFAMFAFSERHIDAGLAAILNATTPIFTVIIAHFWTHNEKFSWHKGLGVACGLIGVAILMGPSARAGFASGSLWGQLACIAASISYGFAGVYGKRFSGMALPTLVTVEFTAATLLTLPLAAIFEQPWTLPMPGLSVWGALLGIALASTVLAYLIYFHILAKAGATNISLVTLLVPVSAVFLSAIFLGERLTTGALAGMIVIGLGLIAIDGRPLKWLKRATASQL